MGRNHPWNRNDLSSHSLLMGKTFLPFRTHGEESVGIRTKEQACILSPSETEGPESGSWKIIAQLQSLEAVLGGILDIASGGVLGGP